MHCISLMRSQKIRHIEASGDLTQDEILFDVTLRNSQTLSEATQRLSQEKISMRPGTLWPSAMGVLQYLHPLGKRECRFKPTRIQ
jgi:hypothetical protein